MRNLFLFFISFVIFVFPQNETKLLRFPAVYDNQIVFSYAGDLFTVNTSGGVARRITSNIGYEMFPRFSPDGKYIAFSAQYDGNTEVYLMPSEGGVPKRLTYTPTLNRDDVSDRMGPNNIVMTWRDNQTIVYRSRGWEWNDWKGQLYTVSINGGLSEQLPLPRGGWVSYSPDKSKIAYNRIFREFRTWKRYRGGQADEIWIYDFKTKTTEKITDNTAQDVFPMWNGDKIYYLSDRDSRMNLFVYDLTSKQTRKLTNFEDFDVKFPSIGNKSIVFENGGSIYLFDLASEQIKKVSIVINEDFNLGRNTIVDVSKSITNYEISPDGKRALFGARGEIFTVPQKNGATRNLTNTSGVHERSSKWSPDGKWIAYISDASGEDEIYFLSQDGKSEPIQLTKGADTYKYSIEWSPDSKKILWNDKMQRLQFVDIETKKITIVNTATSWEITSFDWSPDSRYIAFARPEEEMMTTIYLYSIEDGKLIQVTDGWFGSSNPKFSSDGNLLFFTSSRTFNPRYGQTEWNHIYLDMNKIYFVTLNKDVKSPFEPKSDEVEVKTAPDKKDKKDEKKDDKKDSKNESDVKTKVDVDGLMERIAEVPGPAGNYFNLQSTKDKLFYLRSSSSEPKAKLFVYEFDKQKETELGEINGYEISFDKKKMLVGQSNSYAIIDLPSSKIELKEKLDLSDLKISLDRKAEWKQIFDESWRQMRDFFYVPNLHGVDWIKIKSTYEPLVEYVNHRADLTYIIGEMIGELNAGHAYVGGGDYPKAERIKVGLLGAFLSRDESGYYKINRILKGANWDKDYRSPLTEIGVKANEGNYIIEVDGKSTKSMNDIYESLLGKAGKQVTLRLNSKPSKDGSWETVVLPIDDVQNLIYLNWIQKNVDYVNKKTDGKAGYIHIPDMGPNGLNFFAKYFYPQLTKQGLIIDVRGNGGGNVSPQIIERLQRQISMINYVRNSAITPNPGGMHIGPKVCLLDEFSASDGDIFPYRFKYYKLGKLIGKRSWGGVVGIRGSLPFVDGGYLNRPEFSRYDVEGKEWVMEGYGVDPDIIVDNDPALEYQGIDQQLDKGIEVILEEIKNWKPLAPPPPFPDKKK